jgi:predicted AlkP superfamily pyrophosphatase or phosphodiesterase
MTPVAADSGSLSRTRSRWWPGGRFPFRAVAVTILSVAFWHPVSSAENAHVILVSIDGLAAYHLENDELELPNLRELIASGAWAEGSQSVFPSVTHPSHATLITGVQPRKHGILGNRMTHRDIGKAFHVTTLTRAEAIRVRTLFDAAREKGLVTAALCWPETRGDASIDFNLLHGHEELDPGEVDPDLLASLRQAGIPIDSYYDWSEELQLQGYRDVLLARSAAWLIERHRPHLLAIHFQSTDSMQHARGPEHYLSKAALTQADFNLGLLRQAVRSAGLEDRTTFIIGADHGFHSVHHEVNLHPLLAASGLADRVRLQEGGWTMFLEKRREFDEQRDGAALESFFSEVLKLEGVHRLVRPEAFHELGYPRYEEDPHVAGQYMILGDIDTHLLGTAGTTATGRRPKERPSHGHGYLPGHPRMHAALVLSGRNVRTGIRFGMVRNEDVAPTIAELLHLRMPDVDGRPLHDALVMAR